MTVVREDRVKTITAEILEEFGPAIWNMINRERLIEDIVRAVIAQYDPGRPVPHHGSGPDNQ